MGESKTAKKRKKTESAGIGCFLQALGLGCFGVGIFFGPIGIIFGVIAMILFFIKGSQKAVKLACDNCGTILLDKKVKECPSCHATFTE